MIPIEQIPLYMVLPLTFGQVSLNDHIWKYALHVPLTGLEPVPLLG
jgi:hypothetical protein